jgi:hypothetical protein
VQQPARCVLALRRWHGGGTHGIVVTLGKSCAAPAIPVSALFLTRFTFRRAVSICQSSARYRKIASFWFRSPMHRSFRWMICRGAAIGAACRGRAILISLRSWMRLSRLATMISCHWRSSMIGFVPDLRTPWHWMGTVPFITLAARRNKPTSGQTHLGWRSYVNPGSCAGC